MYIIALVEGLVLIRNICTRIVVAECFQVMHIKYTKNSLFDSNIKNANIKSNCTVFVASKLL